MAYGFAMLANGLSHFSRLLGRVVTIGGLMLVFPGCADAESGSTEAAATSSASASAAPTPSSSGSSAKGGAEAPPRLGIRGFAVTVYAEPKKSSKKLGYLRVGTSVQRSPEPVGKRGCKGGWYRIAPSGYVCANRDATVSLDDPLIRAAVIRPRLDKPMPYRYGFVRAVLPLYLRVPTARQQYKSEFKLSEHLDWYKEHRSEVQNVVLGADDVPVDTRGVLIPGKQLGELGIRKNSSEMSEGELFGGQSNDDAPPFWLREGRRLIPNISGFDVPEYAVFADRARRHTGLAFVASFPTGPDSLRRRFAVTTDLRLAPTTKVKPDSGSPWHGVELGEGGLELPLAFVRLRGAQAYRLIDGEAEPTGAISRRSVHRLKGKVKRVGGEKYYQLNDGRWLHQKDASVVVAPSKWPRQAKRGEKWIEVDLSEQTLVLWHGKRPEYATLVSTGRPAIGDPKTTNSTPRGVFRVYAKHISATMDSDEGASKRESKKRKGDEGYVPQKGDGAYGVTLRRGHGLFKLRDVPHIQYFESNYAIHGAYWHDVFGIPRSHGCINLAPTDSMRVFKWTEPQIPEGWHGVNTAKGTVVLVHK